MFNYHNLNDIEFEHLCKDIVEKKLGIDLRIFATGRDGGIDLTDNVSTNNIVVQVKHYINSTYSNLKSSLKKELPKVKKLNPKKYYICCGMKLTPANINEIYKLFSDYMEDDSSIITLNEIDDFLQDDKNEEIVRKNYKLWLYSSGILTQIFNQDIFIDCESLLCDIEDESQFFVQTSSYNKCLDRLTKHGLILMLGAPGVGKTLISKMLILYFAQQDYKVRYTTNGDIANLKKSLSSNKDVKEIILLDDCLGQHYFNMKTTQEKELISLINYIHVNPHKLLIMNSRITIFNEAKERSEEFHIIVEGQKVVLHTINMDNISLIEKAKIFYNHLKYKNVPPSYYEEIKKDKRYLNIVNHRNYTPRIIEYITLASRISKLQSTHYFKYCIEKLDNPNDIWKEEFERRLTSIDRTFMNTLYSLTETSIDIECLRISFNKRLDTMSGIDKTLNHFDLTLNRLADSLISIYDNKGSKHIGVINPSVNDFLQIIFSTNTLELQSIKNAIVYDIQIERCYKDVEYDNAILNLINSGEILELKFVNPHKHDNFILSHLCKYHVLNNIYDNIVNDFLFKNNTFPSLSENLLSRKDILVQLLNTDMRKFYKIDYILLDLQLVEEILENLYIDELVLICQIIFNIFKSEGKSYNFIQDYTWLCSQLISFQLDEYIDEIDPISIYENYDIWDLVDENISASKYGPKINYDKIIDVIKNWVLQDIDESIENILHILPSEIAREIKINTVDIELDNTNIESMIDSLIEPDDYDEDMRYDSTSTPSFNVIEAIFER